MTTSKEKKIKPNLKVIHNKKPLATPKKASPEYHISSQKGDGTWQGPQLFSNEVQLNRLFQLRYPSLLQTNTALNFVAQKLHDFYPSVFSRSLQEGKDFLKVSEKAKQLAKADEKLLRERRLPLNPIQVEIILGSVEYLEKDMTNNSFEKALTKALIAIVKMYGLQDHHPIVVTENGEDITDKSLLKDITDLFETSYHDNFLALIKDALYDRELLLFSREIDKAIELTERYRDMARLKRDLPNSYWLKMGAPFSISDLLKDEHSYLFSVNKHFYLDSTQELSDEQSHNLAKFMNHLLEKRETEIQGYASYLYHQPPIAENSPLGELQLLSRIQATDGDVLVLRWKATSKKKNETLLLLRKALPEPDVRLFGSANQFIILRLHKRPFVLNMHDFNHPGKTLKKTETFQIIQMAERLLEEIRFLPRLANTCGDILTLSDFAQKLSFAPTFKDFECMIGFRDFPQDTFEAHHTKYLFCHLFFVQEGQVLTLERKMGNKTELVLVAHHAKDKTFLLLPSLQTPDSGLKAAAQYFLNKHGFYKS